MNPGIFDFPIETLLRASELLYVISTATPEQIKLITDNALEIIKKSTPDVEKEA